MAPKVVKIHTENNLFQYVDTLRRNREKRHKNREFFLPWFDTVRRALGPFHVVGSSAKAVIDISAHDFTRPTVLVVGNETWGLSAALKEMCDTIVTIPIAGSATSLNVSCAASIILYEIDKQRRA